MNALKTALTLAVAATMLACDGATARRAPKGDTARLVAVQRTLPAVDEPLVQRRTDWEELEHRLSGDPRAAAAALDDYRRQHGLPLPFWIPDSVSATITQRLGVEEDWGCGRGITVFARRVPVRHPVLGVDPVIEFDSAGRIVREWPLPNGYASPENIAGVSGEELIVPFTPPDSGVNLRVKPNGDYRVSAEPPLPFETSLWIMVAESVYLRVRPKDDGTFTAGASGYMRDVEPGTWVPSGDSGWYARVDSSGAGPRYARAMTRPYGDGPRLVACPRTARFEGMICRGFPDGRDRHERRLAYPTPCS